VGFKAAFRAAKRPEVAGLDKAGPRPARGLSRCLSANLPCSPLAPPDPEAPACRRLFLTAPEGKSGKGRSEPSDNQERNIP